MASCHPVQRETRWRDIRTGLALGCSSTLLTLAVLEIGLRFFHPVPPLAGDLFLATSPLDEGRTARRALVPGWTGRHTTPEFDVPVRINRAALRDDEVAIPAPAGTLRVLGLGDSFLFGHGVLHEETLGVALERALTRRLGRRVEFVNAGVPSFGTADQLDWLKAEGWAYEPDAVMLLFFDNDSQDSIVRETYTLVNGRLRPFARREADAPLPAERLPAVPQLDMFTAGAPNRPTPAHSGWLSRNLHLARLARQALAGHTPTAAQIVKRQTEEHRTLALTTALLLEIERQCRERGVPFLVALTPDPAQTFRRRPPPAASLRDAYAPMTRALEKADVPVIDLLSPLRAADPTGATTFFRKDRHLTARGHRVAAAALEGPLASALESSARSARATGQTTGGSAR
ncbi:MAG TPA: SGNH/GDSL hydrolase family protein [Chthonomonadales bacterium]|nr:SGNH/GDSL hydrolase family protein [Chthonomonadales bacterium]